MMKNTYKVITRRLVIIFLCLILMQAFLLGTKQLVFRFTTETLFSRSMLTMLSMLIILMVIIIFCRYKKYRFSLLPERFSRAYCIITVLALVFFMVTLFVVNPLSLENILMLLYASVVTPVFEELLFRGIIWNRLNECINKEWKTYLIVTVLFALWHIGYAVGLYLWHGGDLVSVISMKVLVGAVFGVITGAIRLKTKNCYVGILVHGVLNALG